MRQKPRQPGRAAACRTHLAIDHRLVDPRGLGEEAAAAGRRVRVRQNRLRVDVPRPVPTRLVLEAGIAASAFTSDGCPCVRSHTSSNASAVNACPVSAVCWPWSAATTGPVG